MAISESGRYANAPIVRVTDAHGVTRPTVYGQVISPGQVSYTLYRLRASDRFDLLAHRLFGDSKLWWYLADLNPEVTTPEDIPAGTVLRIPT